MEGYAKDSDAHFTFQDIAAYFPPTEDMRLRIWQFSSKLRQATGWMLTARGEGYGLSCTNPPGQSEADDLYRIAGQRLLATAVIPSHRRFLRTLILHAQNEPGLTSLVDVGRAVDLNRQKTIGVLNAEIQPLVTPVGWHIRREKDMIRLILRDEYERERIAALRVLGTDDTLRGELARRLLEQERPDLAVIEWETPEELGVRTAIEAQVGQDAPLSQDDLCADIGRRRLQRALPRQAMHDMIRVLLSTMHRERSSRMALPDMFTLVGLHQGWTDQLVRTCREIFPSFNTRRRWQLAVQKDKMVQLIRPDGWRRGMVSLSVSPPPTGQRPQIQRDPYNGDPLAYYRSEHPGVYREELAEKDPALHRRLRVLKLLWFVPHRPTAEEKILRDPEKSMPLEERVTQWITDAIARAIEACDNPWDDQIPRWRSELFRQECRTGALAAALRCTVAGENPEEAVRAYMESVLSRKQRKKQ